MAIWCQISKSKKGPRAPKLKTTWNYSWIAVCGSRCMADLYSRYDRKHNGRRTSARARRRGLQEVTRSVRIVSSFGEKARLRESVVGACRYTFIIKYPCPIPSMPVCHSK